MPKKRFQPEEINGTLRDELLDREIFSTLREAQVLIEQWRRPSHRVWPPSALAYRPPAPKARSWARLVLPPRTELELTAARN